MHEYDLFIPLFYNDGRPIEATKFQALQKRLLEQFGGLTFFPQPNQGLWKMGAVVYRDEMLESTPATLLFMPDKKSSVVTTQKSV